MMIDAETLYAEWAELWMLAEADPAVLERAADIWHGLRTRKRLMREMERLAFTMDTEDLLEDLL